MIGSASEQEDKVENTHENKGGGIAIVKIVKTRNIHG